MKRGGFLGHVAWTGAGIAYTLSATGLFTGRGIAQGMGADVDFVQISDSHIGFHQPANPDVTATLRQSVNAINALPKQPAFVVHTGDITHLSTPSQFDDARAVLSQLKAPLIALPGEHDVIGNDFKPYLTNFKIPQSTAGGWASWDASGVHYIVLLNVFNFEKMGLLGSEQLAWLAKDIASVSAITPVVVFTHVPLYALFPEWGWTTEDGAKAIALLRKFDRVTVLNGHIHQIVTHTDGNLRFASADATAYPQPKPGTAAKPGPMTLPHGDLLHAIGYRTVEVSAGTATIEDHSLG
ncbi:MAG TPA: metallophosphoesterase [Candidatus Baltobacteraceae bacterium]|jgi:3',5'-cyclic AMP phosphodiesterase CpdA|nr:metallophosphoesterase [Candidatus Baltobacteraceae bacterium]